MKIDSKSLGLALTSLLFTACAHQQSAPPGKVGPMMLETRIQKGENLQKLGSDFNVPEETLKRVNGLSDTAELKPGEILYIPVSEKALQSPDLRGRSRLVRSAQFEELPKVGRRAALYAKHRQFAWPVDGHIGSGFGPRNGKRHEGVDILSNSGEPIRAAHDGVVEFVGWKRGYGRTLVIRHQGFKTLYAHCAKITAKRGQAVKAGENIAVVGNSGNADGIHLHFEYLTMAGTALDPMPHFARALAH